MATLFVGNMSLVHSIATIAYQLLQQATMPYIVTLSAFILVFTIYSIKGFKSSEFPLVNGKKAFELTRGRSKKEFMGGALEMILKRLKQAPGKPFRMIADFGEITILPPEYAYEIRNHDQLSFTQAAFKCFHAHLPGFEGFREGTTESQIMKLIARHQLTHQLTLVTKPVSDECAAALQDIYTESKEWHEVVVKDANLQLMARITSRVFLGEELCRNPHWLRITSTYTVVAYRAIAELRLWPAWLQSVVHWFLPQCTAARALVREARGLIEPLLQQRRVEKAESVARGETHEYNDAIEWLEQTSREKGLKYDAASAQLSLSVAALHSTTDFFTQVTLDIASHPEIIQPLRAEIVSVFSQGGWTKHSLYNLKLMDSVLKESQRMKPIAIASMRRLTTTNVTLSDGIVIPKNSLTFVSAHRNWDAGVYENPHVWDGYRFLKMRQQPGKENTAQFVSVSPDHMGFGYGLHACPGRFFASEEIKIALCHILMEYDLKPVLGSNTEPQRFGLSMTANPTARLAVRRRQEEIPIQLVA